MKQLEAIIAPVSFSDYLCAEEMLNIFQQVLCFNFIPYINGLGKCLQFFGKFICVCARNRLRRFPVSVNCAVVGYVQCIDVCNDITYVQRVFFAEDTGNRLGNTAIENIPLKFHQ